MNEWMKVRGDKMEAHFKCWNENSLHNKYFN